MRASPSTDSPPDRARARQPDDEDDDDEITPEVELIDAALEFSRVVHGLSPNGLEDATNALKGAALDYAENEMRDEQTSEFRRILAELEQRDPAAVTRLLATARALVDDEKPSDVTIPQSLVDAVMSDGESRTSLDYGELIRACRSVARAPDGDPLTEATATMYSILYRTFRREDSGDVDPDPRRAYVLSVVDRILARYELDGEFSDPTALDTLLEETSFAFTHWSPPAIRAVFATLVDQMPEAHLDEFVGHASKCWLEHQRVHKECVEERDQERAAEATAAGSKQEAA